MSHSNPHLTLTCKRCGHDDHLEGHSATVIISLLGPRAVVHHSQPHNPWYQAAVDFCHACPNPPVSPAGDATDFHRPLRTRNDPSASLS